MTAQAYDIYNFSAPFVAPTAPSLPPTATAVTATATAQGRSLMQRLSDSLLFNASVVLGVFAGIVCAFGTILWDTPLGQVLPTQNFGLWLGVIAGGLAVAGMMTAVLVATVQRVTA